MIGDPLPERGTDIFGTDRRNFFRQCLKIIQRHVVERHGTQLVDDSAVVGSREWQAAKYIALGFRQLGLRRSSEKSKLAQPTPAPNTPLRRSHGVNRCHWFLSELSGFFVTTTVLVLLGLCPLGAANALGTVSSRFAD